MKILLTGSTGFLGRIILKELRDFQVITLSRTNSAINADLTVGKIELPKVNAVIHAAGKAHIVPKTQKEIEEFNLVNVIGTENLLNSLQANLPESFVFISSVSVYGRIDGNLISEEEPLNAKDPYGISKIQAEKLVKSWCKINNVRLSILRLPLLVGAQPPGNLGSMIKAIRNGYYVNIAGGKARKSMVIAQDVACIIPKAFSTEGTYNLTDGFHPSVSDLSRKIALQLGKHQSINIPAWSAVILAKAGDLLGRKFPFNSVKLNKLTSDLTFDDSKARTTLGWAPNPVLESSVFED